MKSNILASIALFGSYRKKNLDTYDLVAQYITAVIAQKEYTSFTAETMQSDLKELYQIEIPIGVIKSVCKNRIEDVSLANRSFTCSRIPKDEIEKEYTELTSIYETLFSDLVSYINEDTDEFEDHFIRECFSDYLIYGYTSETRLNSLFAGFITGNQSSKEIKQNIDLLSSGLISYNGLSYTDSAGNSGAWTDRLAIYLDASYLFSCAGYNGPEAKAVFQEFYDLVTEVNTSYRRRTKKSDNLIELKVFKDTWDVLLSVLTSAKTIIDKNMAPDPSKRALVKIVQESQTSFDVNVHLAKIESVVNSAYHIVLDNNDYDRYVVDPRYVTYDREAITNLQDELNPRKDELTSRKIDYYSRVFTIIKALRGEKTIKVFEECRYIFLTSSRIGRKTSMTARTDGETVSLHTDIDFFVSRLWFKLNKQLVDDQIPIPLDIIARSQAVLSREVTRKVRLLYEELRERDLTSDEKKSLYIHLKDMGQILESGNGSSTQEALAFIESDGLDDFKDNYDSLKKRAEDADRKAKELLEAQGELQGKLKETENNLEDLRIDFSEKTKQHAITLNEANSRNENQIKLIKQQKMIIALLMVALLGLIIILIVLLSA